jgi:Ca-activated chloride channel family protein
MQDERAAEPETSPSRGAEILTPDGRSLPLVSAKLRIDAGGGLARVVLEQTFENPYDDALAVTYKMPLPVDGAVSGYSFRLGARTITGKVDRKETARARFEAAILEGKTAALLEQDKADVFTQEIGNLPPRQTIVAEIVVDLRLAWRHEGEWELRFPTVIGPRYLGAELPAEERQASHVELAEGGVRGRVHLELRIADAITEGRRASSPSHTLRARTDGAIELEAAAGARLDRDVVVRWPVARRDVGLALQVARPKAGANARAAYALLSIVPPAPDAGYAAVPRDLIVLLDTSGSMSGGPLEQGKRVVAALIDSLSDDDQLEVIEFSTRPNRYARSPVPGTKSEKAKAITWVMARRAEGGTEMQAAIVDALRGLRPGAQRQVVLVTDGYVGGEEKIVTLLHESLPEACRMHVVGVGSAVNRALAASLARAGRGAEVLVGLEEDAERAAKALVEKTRAPVLTDLVIAGEALVEHAPEHLPDVFAGAPVLAALSVRPGGGEIVVRGKLARGDWEQRIAVPAIEEGEGNQAVVKLYGRERVADLEMRWTIGREVKEIDREIESIGVVFQIATRRTSWVAIDDDRSVDPRRGSRHEEIPQELPHGTTMASFTGAPMTAQSFGAVAAAPVVMSSPPSRSTEPPRPAMPMRPRMAKLAEPAKLRARPAAAFPASRPPTFTPHGAHGAGSGSGGGSDSGDERAGAPLVGSTGGEALSPQPPATVAPSPQSRPPALSAPGPERASMSAPRSLIAETVTPARRRRSTQRLLAALVVVGLILLAVLAWISFAR